MMVCQPCEYKGVNTILTQPLYSQGWQTVGGALVGASPADKIEQKQN